MIIRDARTEDLPSCEELLKIEELQFVGGDYADATYLGRHLDDRYFIVAEEAGTIIGCALGESLKAGGAILWMVAVDKEQRGQGIGKQLINAFEDRCKEQEKEWLYLLGLSTEQHERLYTGLGYKKGKQLVEYLKEPLQ